MEATLTFLGTGTSMGVPTLGCDCAVCTSAVSPGGDPHNRRTRPSIRLAYNGHTVLIDTGPDFHAQALREGIRRVDAVLYTHGHADHVMGFDDLRPLSFRTQANLPVYADEATANSIERIFEYTFRKEDRYPTSARVTIHRIDPTPGAGIELFGACFQRIPVTHGREEITGYRFGSAAYLTDMSDVPEVSLPLLQDLDVLDHRRPPSRSPPQSFAPRKIRRHRRTAKAKARLLHPHEPRSRPRRNQRQASHRTSAWPTTARR